MFVKIFEGFQRSRKELHTNHFLEKKYRMLRIISQTGKSCPETIYVLEMFLEQYKQFWEIAL